MAEKTHFLLRSTVSRQVHLLTSFSDTLFQGRDLF
jgi:hypothetical protein